MSDFINLDAKTPATLEAVVMAVTRLSTLTEDQILELVSSGNLREYFPFRPGQMEGEIEDSVDEADLVEASPLPLSRRDYARLVQSSMPSRGVHRAHAAAERNRMNDSHAKTPSKSQAFALRDMFMKRLDVDADVASVLVQRGFSTIEDVVSAPPAVLKGIEEFDDEIIQELDRRARNVLITRTTAEALTMAEVGSKLDLALAYMDLGDPEGARSILDEIVHEESGNRETETLHSKKQHSEG